MNVRTASRLAWGTYSLSLALVVAGLAVGLASGDTGAFGEAQIDTTIAITMGLVGALVASRRRENVLGWLLLAMSLISAVAMFSGVLALSLVLDGRSGDAGWPAWVWNWITTLLVPAGLLPTVILLFPDGRLPARRWRWVVSVGWVLTVIATISSALDTVPIELGPPGTVTTVRNPAGIVDVGESLAAVWIAGMLVLVASVVGLIQRLRRSSGRERQQLKWFAYVIASTSAALVALIAFALVAGDEAIPDWVFDFVISLGYGVGVPVTFGVAIFGYGLYEIDVVIRKTVVYALFAAFATAVYLGAVVGVGTWVGRDSSFLTMAAAVVVAITFQPVRHRLTRLANRLVFGKRATPYEILADFSGRVGETYSTVDLLPRMARVLAEGAGAVRADVWLRVGGELRPTASWPPDEQARPIPLANGELPPMPDADAAYPVRHRDELLGALTLKKPPSDPLSPTDEKLVSDLAGQAGLVLSNVRLTTELEANVDELRALHARLVSAQDEERRKIERNIHDGAQQQLVALAVKLRLADSFVGRDDERAHTMLGELQTEANGALDDLRDLARGIYPPLLADQGLGAALEAQARRSPITVTVECEGVERHPQEVEAAVYFSCLEALQNVAKYAEASRAVIRLRQAGDDLRFEVVDDGRGFDPGATGYGTGLQGMSDRLSAISGTLEVQSAPGSGTTISGHVPTDAARRP